MAMNLVYTAVLVLGISSLGESYSKYGRTCKDIGCTSFEQCVMKEDPCSIYQRGNDCGLYPACERVSSSSHRTCSGFVCPPSQKCVMDGSHPRCVDDKSIDRHQVGYDTQNLNNLNTGSNNNAPSAPLPPGYHPPGGTTSRPHHNGQPNYNQGGYAGGAVGSGYPGQPGNYPNQYQNRGGYPGYPGQNTGGFNNPGGYPGGYPNSGYPNSGYSSDGRPTNTQGQGYNPYGSQSNYGNNQNGYRSGYGYGYGGASPSDGFSDSLKQIGLFCLLLTYLVNRTFAV